MAPTREGACEPEAMGSELFLLLYTLYHAGNAHVAMPWHACNGSGKIQPRSIVEGFELCPAFDLPTPLSLPSGRGEAGAYRIRP